MNILQQDRLQASSYFYDPKREVYMTVRRITPDMASELLKGRIKNRNISPATVRLYKDFMLREQWVLNGEPIIFGANQLLDGQHRLTACAESGVSFDAIWIELGNSEVFKTLNQGRRRGGADVLKIGGYSYVNNLFASICILAKVDASGELGWHGFGAAARMAIPNHEIEEAAQEYPYLEVSCRKCDRLYKHLRVKKGSMVALHYMLRRAETDVIELDDESSKSKADEFMESLSMGVGLEFGNPILPFRNALLKQLTERMKIPPHFIIRGGVITWNNWIRGKQNSRLQVGKSPNIPKLVRVHREQA